MVTDFIIPAVSQGSRSRQVDSSEPGPQSVGRSLGLSNSGTGSDMAQLRRRKLQDADNLPHLSRSIKKTSNAARQPRLFIFILLSLVAITFVIGTKTTTFHPVIEHIASRLGYVEPVYAVIIDAGSTGSRVLAYTFHKTFIGGELVLESELFKEVKPGLSSYVDDPKMGANSILSLVEEAHTVVPKEYRAATPLLLRATAGLRLLNPVAADKLIEVVRHGLMSSGYKIGEDAIDIMDGVDEGICSWFTVNFLQDKLSNDMTSAALDLGGGSTQITYELHKEDSLKPVRIVPGPHRNISLFTYSYLNLGLMAARRGVLLAENEENESHPFSECINPIIKDSKWRYANVDYFVSGPQKNILYRDVKETVSSVSERIPVVRIKKCRELVRSVVLKQLPPLPNAHNITKHNINAFSYYFDRATEAGLIDPINGGIIAVKDFKDASERECATANVDQPWACFDLTYISILLHEAFHLTPDTKLELVKKIKGHEISWALGLAYNNLIKKS